MVGDYMSKRLQGMKFNKLVKENISSNMKFIELAERSGTTEALNTGLKEAENEIVVFIDASIMFEPDSLKNLLVNIHDLQMEEQQKQIIEAFENWKGKTEQIDDVLSDNILFIII